LVQFTIPLQLKSKNIMLAPQYKNKMHQRVEFMSVREYAKSRNITPQAVYQAIANNWQLPGVSEVIKSGKVHLLKMF